MSSSWLRRDDAWDEPGGKEGQRRLIKVQFLRMSHQAGGQLVSMLSLTTSGAAGDDSWGRTCRGLHLPEVSWQLALTACTLLV